MNFESPILIVGTALIAVSVLFVLNRFFFGRKNDLKSLLRAAEEMEKKNEFPEACFAYASLLLEPEFADSQQLVQKVRRINKDYGPFDYSAKDREIETIDDKCWSPDEKQEGIQCNHKVVALIESLTEGGR